MTLKFERLAVLQTKFIFIFPNVGLLPLKTECFPNMRVFVRSVSVSNKWRFLELAEVKNVGVSFYSVSLV